MKRIKVVLVLVVAGALALVLRPSDASSLPTCDVTWAAAGDGDWHTGANWSTGLVPASGQFVCIGEGNDVAARVTLGSSTTVAGVRVGSSGGTAEQRLVLAITGYTETRLTVDGDADHGGIQVQASGTLELRNDFSGSYPVVVAVGGEGARLVVADGGTLDILPGNNGGGRHLAADVLNLGTINVDEHLDVTAAPSILRNEGTVDVAANKRLLLSGAGKTFEQAAGSIVTATDHGIQVTEGAEFAFSGGTAPTDSRVYVSAATLSFAGSPADTVGSYRMLRSSTLVGDVPAGHEVILDLYDSVDTVVTAPADFANHGTIVMTNSYSSSYSTRLAGAAGVQLTNTGTIRVVGSSGGRRSFEIDRTVNEGLLDLDHPLYLDRDSATIVNDGTVDIAANQWLELSGGAKAFEQRSGSITMAIDHGIRLYGGASFTFSGGSAPADRQIYLRNSLLSYTGSPVATTGSFELNGGSATISGDIPAGHTVTATVDEYVNTTLQADASFTNNGTIVLSNRLSSSYSTTLTGAPGTVLTNAGVLRSEDGPAGGGRALGLDVVNEGELAISASTSARNLTNTGEVTVASGRTLKFDGGTTSFVQSEGTVSMTSDRAIEINGGSTFVFEGGVLSPEADVYVQNSTLRYVGAPVGTTAAFELLGAVALEGDVPVGHRVTATQDSYYDTVISVPTSFTNAGTLVLSNRYSAGYATTISGPAGSVLTNVGELWADNVYGGPKYLNIEVENTGSFKVDVTVHATKVVNNGTVAIAAGQVLRFDGGSEAFVQESGSVTMAADHGIQLYNGATFEVAGGALPSDRPVYVQNSTLRYQAGTDSPSGYFELLGAVQLHGDIPAGHLVKATMDSYYNTTVTVPGDFVNHGTLQLSNRYSAGYSTTVTGPAGTVLTNEAVVRADNVYGGPKYLDVALVNNGELYADVSIYASKITNNGDIAIAANQQIQLAGAAEEFEQVAGTVTTATNHGIQLYQGSRFVFSGGTMTPAHDVYVHNSVLEYGGSPTLTTGSFELMGSPSLVGDIPVGHRVTASVDTYVSTGVQVPASFTNNGTLVLANRYSGGYSTTITGPGDGASLTNNGTILSRSEYGGYRAISGLTVTNNGTIETHHDLHLSALSNLAEGSLTGGRYVLAAPLRVPGVDVDTLAATVVMTGSTLRDGAGADLLDQIGTITQAGRLELDDHDLTLPAALDVAGEVVNTASVLSAPGYDISGAVSLVSVDALMRATGPAKEISLSGGTISGIGTLEGNVSVLDGATVAPGASPGTLTITGDYLQESGATLVVDIDGPVAGEGYDLVAVSGNATIAAGSLLRLNGSGYQPAIDSTYDILVAGGTLTGSFTEADTTGWDVGTDGMYYESSVVAGDTARLTALQRLVTISRPGASIGEGSSPLTFTVTLTKYPEVEATVAYSTFVPEGLHRHASAGADYVPVTDAVLTFEPGETVKDAEVVILQDVIDEYDTEDLGAELGATSGNVVHGAVVDQTVAITDDDAAPVADIVLDAEIDEGDSGLTVPTYTVSLTGTTEKLVTVDWATVDGTATAPADYRAASESLVYPIGEAGPQVIAVEVMTDLLNEADETFSVALSAADDTATVSPTAGAAVTTIANDDPLPTLAISGGQRVTEGDAGTTNVEVPVYLSTKSGRTVTVQYAAAAATAAIPADLTPTAGELSFAPGETAKTIVVPVVGDAVHELDESFTVALSAPVYATVTTGSSSVVIEDDDAAPVLAISGPAEVVEGTSGTPTIVTYTVTKTGATALDATVTVATAAGSAVGGADYTAVTRTVTIAAGATTATVDVPVLADALDEDAETFTVSLAGPSGATLAASAVETTITDDDEAPSLSIMDAGLVAEGHAGTSPAPFAVVLSAPSGKTVTATYAAAAGTAAVPGDVAGAGTVTFLPGETAKTVTVAVSGDVVDEADETFTVALADLVNAAEGDTTAAGTIADDDDLPTLSVSDLVLDEGDDGYSGGSVTVTLSAVSGRDVRVDFGTQDATAVAGQDYLLAAGTLTFTPGVTAKTFDVVVAGDGAHERDEAFTVVLSGQVNATLADATGAVTVANDDAAPVLALSGPVTITEGTGETPTAATYTITKTGATELPASVRVDTSAGTAAAGSDFAGVSRTVTLAAGQTTATVDVEIQADSIDEGDENFSVALSDAADATLDAAATAVASTITDDDTDGEVVVPVISIADAGILAEGSTGTTPGRFVVSLSAATTRTVSVDYATFAGTAGVPGDVAGSGTIEFAPGERSKTISVAIVGDTLDEADETFTVTLANPAEGTLGTETAAATIADDDDAPVLTVVETSVPEGASGTTGHDVTVELSSASGRTVTVDYLTTDGTAAAGEDYETTSGQLVFVPGETSKTVAVSVIGDDVHEISEGFTLSLAGAEHAGIAGLGRITITNDDAAPVLTLSGPTAVTEGTGAVPTRATYTITKTGATALTASATFATTAGSADFGDDYLPVSRTITLAPGEASTAITVDVIADGVDEEAETFTASLTAPAGATLGSPASVETTITDDDDPSAAPAVSIGDAGAVAEGSTGTTPARFLVTLSAAAAGSVSVDYATTAGTASVPGDVSGAGTLTFAAGETAKTLEIPVVGDALDEDDETFTVVLSALAGAVAGDLTAGATIVDDDDTPSLSIADGAAVEGDGGPTVHDLTVTLSAPSGRTVSAVYEVSDGASGLVEIAAGETTAVVPVTVIGDEVHELDETISVTLSSPANATLAGATADLAVTDDDAAPVLQLSGPAAVLEGTGDGTTTPATYTITKTGATALPSEVTVLTTAGTADDDYLPVLRRIVLGAGETTATVDVDVLADLVDEDAETFTVSLVDPTGATLGTAEVETTITDDDDAPTVSVLDPAAVVEGHTGTATVHVSVGLSAPSSRTVTVDYAVAGGTSGVLTFEPGATWAAVDVTVAGDTLDEDDQTIAVTLAAPVNAILGDEAASVTVIDDDDRPVVSLSGPSTVDEAAGSATYTVELSTASGREVRVDYATTHGTTSVDDLTAAAGTLVFAAGETSKPITVAIAGDDVPEAGEEFTVALSGAVNTVVGAGSVTTTIVDDDGVAVVNVAPVAGDDEATTTEDTPVDIDVLADDSDANGDPLTVVGSSAPGHGTVACSLSGTCTYTPAADWSGTDSFTYSVTDGNGAFDTGLVTVTVSAASAESVVAEGGTVSTGDTATEDEPLRIGVRSPESGTVAITDAEDTDFTAVGYDVLAVESVISAPAASAGDPLELTFTIHESVVVPPATSLAAAADLAVFRNGTKIGGACTGAGATPDPCVASVTVGADELVVVVRTSAASTWNFALAKPAPPASTTTTTSTTTTVATTPTTAPTTTTTRPSGGGVGEPVRAVAGYWIAAADGSVMSYGSAPRFGGSLAGQALSQPIVGLEATPSGQGYWLVARDGGVFAFGDAGFHGSTGAIRLNQPIVGMASTRSGQGYWLVASDGGIFAFGDAAFHGSTGAIKLNKPIVGMEATPSGKGYWLVATDGGIFTFGDANFFGSTGAMHLNQPIVGMTTSPTGKGYWLVASDGGIFTFGDTSFFGSTGDLVLNQPIIGMSSTPSSKGYWLVARDGGLFAFGDAAFHGAAAGILSAPAIGAAW